MSTARAAKTVLRIPKRIERGPTDILKALASTIKHIPNKPEQSFQDDPYLIPARPADRRLFMLAKLNGQKTAKFILNKNPELFFRDDAEPKVDAFLPREEFNSEMEFAEEDIKWCIENNDAVNGVIAYNSLVEKSVKLSDETLLSFLELLCYTNEENLLDLIDLERTRFLPNSEETLVKQTWKNSGLASKIFNQIKTDLNPPRVYSAMIAGLSKYNEHSAAQQIFEEFKDNYPDEGLYTEAYSGILNSIRRLYSSVSTAHEAIDEVVKHMERNLVAPNLHVFNSILKAYRSFNVDDATVQKVLTIMNDMKSLDIQPSLFTYANLIVTICRLRGNRVYGELVHVILQEIENSDQILNIRDERDVEFLSTIMNTFTNNLNNLKFANKLHKIYLKQPNLFANHKAKTNYLNNYFKLMITTDTLENTLEFYREYVPLNFMPAPDSYEALAEALDLYQAPEDVIKSIGQDIIEFRLYDRIKNDAIFRKDPNYVTTIENLNKV